VKEVVVTYFKAPTGPLIRETEGLMGKQINARHSVDTLGNLLFIDVGLYIISSKFKRKQQY
jgi:hypothetical protein